MVCLESDVWAFGCILLEMATGLKTYQGLNEFSLCFKIIKGVTPLEFALDQNMCTDLI